MRAEPTHQRKPFLSMATAMIPHRAAFDDCLIRITHLPSIGLSVRVARMVFARESSISGYDHLTAPAPLSDAAFTFDGLEPGIARIANPLSKHQNDHTLVSMPVSQGLSGARNGNSIFPDGGPLRPSASACEINSIATNWHLFGIVPHGSTCIHGAIHFNRFQADY